MAFYLDPASGRQSVAYVAQDPNALATDPRFVDLIAGEEVTTLPPGLAIQTLSTNVATSGLDKYLSFGVIFFDENGQLAANPYWVRSASTLGTQMQLSTDLKPTGSSPPTVALVSHPGFVLYDRQNYTNQAQPGSGKPFDDASLGYSASFTSQTAPSSSDKQAEEAWLDQNGQVMAVKPNDGGLVRNQ